MEDITNPINYKELSEILIDTVKGRLYIAEEPKYQNGAHVYLIHISENNPANR